MLSYTKSGGGSALLFFIDGISPCLLRSRLCTFLIILLLYLGCVLFLHYFCHRENWRMAWLGQCWGYVTACIFAWRCPSWMLHGSRSLQQPQRGEKSCQPVSTDREGGGLGGVWTGSWTLLSAQHQWLSHHSSITSPLPCVLPRGLEQLQMSRKAAGRASDEEGKGKKAMPWVRLQEKKQGLQDTQDQPVSLRFPNHRDFIPVKGVQHCY